MSAPCSLRLPDLPLQEPAPLAPHPTLQLQPPLWSRQGRRWRQPQPQLPQRLGESARPAWNYGCFYGHKTFPPPHAPPTPAPIPLPPTCPLACSPNLRYCIPAARCSRATGAGQPALSSFRGGSCGAPALRAGARAAQALSGRSVQVPAPALPAPVRRAEAGFACHIPASRAAPRRAACEVVLLPGKAAGRGRGTRRVGLVLAGAGAGGRQAEGANELRIHTGEARVPLGTVCHLASVHGTPRWA